MASSDITVSGLSKIGNENAEYLVSKIRTIPGFPKEGILFRDFMPVLADARAFGLLLDALEAALPVAADEFDIIAGLADSFLVLRWQRAWARASSQCARLASFLRKPLAKAMTLNMGRPPSKSRRISCMRDLVCLSLMI